MLTTTNGLRLELLRRLQRQESAFDPDDPRNRAGYNPRAQLQAVLGDAFDVSQIPSDILQQAVELMEGPGREGAALDYVRNYYRFK